MTPGKLAKLALAAALPRSALTHGRRDGWSLALTFDDGPHPANTPRLLDLLDAHNVSATFFVVASVAEQYPQIVRDIHRRGHQVASHGHGHVDGRVATAAEVVADVIRAHAAIEGIVGVPLRRDYRPPYGTVNLGGFARLALRGYRYVFWSLDSLDSDCSTTEEAHLRFERFSFQAGDVILLHDDYTWTIDAMPTLIARVRSAGLGFDRVDAFGAFELLESDRPEGGTSRRLNRRAGYGKRDLAAQAAVAAGVVSLVRAARSRGSSVLRVLAYHRVVPHTAESRYPFDLTLISAWESEFEWQLDYLKRNYDPITCADVIAALDGRQSLPKRAVLLTFDDGFSDNYLVAFPALRDRAMPATIFLTTGYIGRSETFWFDHLIYLVARTQLRSIVLPGLPVVQLDNSHESRTRQAGILLRHLKGVSDTTRRELIAALDAQLGVEIDPRDRLLSEPMTWSDVKTMVGAGIEFGSHSVSHPILSRVKDEDELRSELVESRRRIELECEVPALSIAYPVGGADSIDDRVVEMVREAGYRLGFTYETGLNAPAPSDPFRIRRLRVERYTNRAMFAAMLEIPDIVGYR